MMKKIIIAGISLILFTSITQAANWVAFKEGVSSPTPPEIKILKEDITGITLEANIFGVNVEVISTEYGARNEGTQTFQILNIPGYEYSFTQEVGKPKLPLIQVMLVIPDGVDVSISPSPHPSSFLPSPYLIYPVPKQVLKTTPEGYSYIADEFYIDEEFYQQDLWYPEESQIPNLKSTILYIRDQRVLRLEIYPIQFNPAKKQLRVYPNLKIEINYLRKKGVSVSLKQPEMASPFANVLKGALLNYKPSVITRHLPLATKRVGTVSYITNLKNPNNSADYLIITSEAFYNNPDLYRLAKHRAEYNGFDVAVVNTTSIYNEFPITEEGTTTSIKDFIRYVYNNWQSPSIEDNHIGYVLLFGDGEEGEASYVPSKWVAEIYPSFDRPVSDSWYVCINDENLHYQYWTPDIMIGRLSIDNGTETRIVADKIIQYEKNPTPGQWRNRALLIKGADSGGMSVFEYIKNELLIPVEFEITEIIGDENPPPDAVYDEFNNGHLLVAYAGHGSQVSWGVAPQCSLFIKNIEKKLFNRDKLPIVFADSCYTALFQFPIDPDESLGEMLILEEGGGAIAYWGASARTGGGGQIISQIYKAIMESTPYKFSLGEMVLNQYLYSWFVPENLLGDPALTISRVPIEQNKAELEIEPIDINFNPKFPKPNEKTEITASIHNLGDIDAINVLVKFFLGNPKENGIEIGSKTITTVRANGTKTIEINWTPDLPIGEYKIYVVIDPYDTIPEVGTINNTAYKPLEVNIYQQGWYQTHPQMLRIEDSPAVGDVDGDGDLELVGLIRGWYTYIWHCNGELVDNWPRPMLDIAGTPILADIDNDNELEIIISGRKRFYVLNYDGSDVPGFPKEGTNSASPAIGDIDNDGDLEIVVAMSGKLYVWHHDGSLVTGDWPKEIKLGGLPPIIADIDKDGNLEIIVFAEGKIYVFNGAGNLISGQWPKTIPGEVFSNGYAVGNIDTDDELEIVIISKGERTITLYALNPDGSDVVGCPKQIGGNNYDYPCSVVLGDIDNDGDMEIIIDGLYYLYVLHHDGSNVSGWPKYAMRGRGPSDALIADMDNDKQLEVIESGPYEYNYNGTISIWNNDGSHKLNLYMKPEDERTSPFVIADIDLDGDVEVICAGEEPMGGWSLPKVYIWDYEGKCRKGTLEWPMANHDARRTNCYNTDIICPAKIINLTAKNPTAYSVDLTWMATGDDYEEGTATLYYLRYATYTITPQNWHLTNKATCTITPKSAGSQESFTVPGLQPNTTYYFCIRARDEEFNTAPLSNVPFVTTLSPAVITISPTQGAVGKLVTVWGTNFYPTEPIRLSFGNTVTVAFINATAGSFTLTFTITDEGFGSVTVTAYGFESKYTATTYFFIPGVQYLVFGTISSPQSAGQGFGVKITAFNEYGEVVTNFKGTATLADTSSTILPTATSNFISGIWQGTATITKAGTTSITAGSAGKFGTSNPFYVETGTPTKFIVYPQNSVDIPAGESVSITAQLMDVYDNPVGSSGITCDVAVTVIAGTAGILSATTTTTNQSGQIATITYSVSTHAGDQAKLSINNYQLTIINYSGTITTIPGTLTHFILDPIATQTAGVNFLIRITAMDKYDNLTPFQGTASLIDSTNSLNPRFITSFTAGIWQGLGSITVAGIVTITAVYGTISGTSKPFLVRGGTLTCFKIATITDQTAGVGFNITVIAKDRWGNVADGFTSQVSLTDFTKTINPTQTTNFTAGLWQSTVTITKAGTTSITATYLDKFATSNPFYVEAGFGDLPTMFLVYPQDSVNIPAGGSVSITAQLMDAYGNPIGSSGITCDIAVAVISGTSGTLSTTTTTTNQAGQIATITYYVSTRVGDQAKIKLIPPLFLGIPTFSGTITTLPADLHHFTFDPIGTQTAGVDFPIRITAKDEYDNTTPFQGTAFLIDLTNSLNPQQTSAFVDGVWTGVGSITIAGITDITAIHNSELGISPAFGVSGSAIQCFETGTIATQTAGVGFNITVTAKDRWGNIADGFTGIADLTDITDTLTPTTTTNFTAGFWQGTVTITKSGTTAITSHFSLPTSHLISGTSNPFAVIPALLDYFVIATITNQIAGLNFTVTITAMDKYGNTATSFTSQANIKDSSLSLNPQVTTNFTAGIWQGLGSITKAGITTIFAEYQGKRGTSNPFVVTSASLHHFRFDPIPNQTAGQGFNITIVACDAFENTVTTYTDTNTLTDTTGSIFPEVTHSFNQGILRDFQVVISIALDNILITTKGNGITGTSNPFNVSAGNLDHFRIGTITSPQKAGVRFLITIQAEDSQNNITNYQGIVFFSDVGNTILPTSTTNFSAGRWQGFVSISKTGSTLILAQAGGKYGVSNEFKVVAGDLARIEISPKDVGLKVNESQGFNAWGYDAYGNTVEMENGKWKMENEIGRVTNEIGNKTTFVAGTRVGTGTLKCSSGEITATASITITPGDLANIIITPATVTVEVDGTCTFTARGYDRYGNGKEVIGERWLVIGEVGILVDTWGSRTTFVAGRQPQEGTITYQEKGIIGSSRITVRHGNATQFEFEPIPHHLINTPFRIKVKALDKHRNFVKDYNQSAVFTTTYGNLEVKGAKFNNGVFEGTVTIKTNRAAPDVSVLLESDGIKQASRQFSVLYDDAKEIRVEEAGLKLDIDSHSVGKDYYLEISQPSLNEHDIEIANLQVRDDPALKQLNDTIIRIIPKDGGGKPITTKPGTKSTTLTIYYPQPATNIAEETLKLHILDNSGIEARWVEIKGSVVLPGINMIYADVPQFGTFILIGSIIPATFDQLVVYPNPFKPKRGDESIIFEGLPKNSYIRIYDISGHLIKDVENQQAVWEWDVKDRYGQKVDSGIYIYIITTEETEDRLKKIGKIAIIR